MVPTDTHDRGGYMGGCSATLTSSSVVDGRPDRPSRGRWRIVSDVCRECSLKSIHCSKVHDSYLSRTPRPDKFTRPSVRTRRGNHPAPSGRPPRGGAKVTWFRYSCEYRRYSRDDPGDLTTSRLLSPQDAWLFSRAKCPPSEVVGNIFHGHCLVFHIVLPHVKDDANLNMHCLDTSLEVLETVREGKGLPQYCTPQFRGQWDGVSTNWGSVSFAHIERLHNERILGCTTDVRRNKVGSTHEHVDECTSGHPGPVNVRKLLRT